MVILGLLLLGLCLGSFVNAVVWRVHEQESTKSQKAPELSVIRGRSMCPHCKHTLSGKDLIPLLSWLSLRGKCRYCRKPISIQYPVVEVTTAVLFVASYIWWPYVFDGTEKIVFGLWLLILTGLLALLVYDVRWMLLPNRIMAPLAAVATFLAIVEVSSSPFPLKAVVNTALGVLVGGGIFYVLFQVSKGKWIGGGDVKLGWLLGLIAATPARSILFIFIASLLGTLVALPLLKSAKLQRHSAIPFGPFLIAGLIIVQLFGGDMLQWYQQTFIGYT